MQKRLPVRAILALGTLALLISASLGGFFAYRNTVGAHAAGTSSSLLSSYAKISAPKVAYAGKTLNAVQFACQQPNSQFRCFTPMQMEHAYNALSLYSHGTSGQGQTIVIMDFSQSPTIAQDLHSFDKLFGLPDPTLNVIAPNGTDPADPNTATEITLDVEYAHALAPLATIDLVLAKAGTATTVSDLYANFLQGVSYAVNNKLGNVISMSYGFPEPCINSTVAAQSHAIFAQAAANGITTIDSAGDSGATVPNCTFSDYIPHRATQYPAVEPTVLDVGGTYLDTQAGGAYLGETAWTQVSTNPNNGAGGGGFSATQALPAYQQAAGIKGTGRAIPDVSYNADPRSGVIVLCSSCGGGANTLLVVGGTSAGAPQWAGILALASQYAGHSMGFINPVLYQLYTSANYSTDFHDITIGNNSYQFTSAAGKTVTVTGFAAQRGWDAVTGIGTPIVHDLVPALAKATKQAK